MATTRSWKSRVRCSLARRPFPFHAQVREVIDPFIQRAILGELSPADALSQAAAAVDEELSRLGYGM